MHIDLFDIEDCDDSAAQAHVVEPAPPLTILPLSDWLGALASALGAPGFYDQVAKPSCRPAPKVGLSCSCVKKVTIRFSDSDVRSSYPHPMQPVTAGFPGNENSGSSPRTRTAAVAAPMT